MFWQLHCVLMLNWFVWNRTDYLYKNWIWHWITNKGWYAIKTNQSTNSVQTFRKPKSFTVLFHVPLTYGHSSNWRSSYPLDVDISFVCWSPPVPGVIFHLIASLFEPPVPLKNPLAWHAVFSIYLLKHFKLNFHNRTNNFTFIHCSVFIVRSWGLIFLFVCYLIAYQPSRII